MTILLTGGHSGIGLELSKLLLKEGHHLGLILRNEKRKADAVEAIGTAENIDFFYADLSKQAAIVQVANDIKAKWDHLDGLFNNAGLLADKAYYSDQGNEMQFEINSLAPYLLARELKPLFDEATQPFIVNTATGAMHQFKQLDIDDLKKPKKFVKLMGSYMNSKFAMVSLMNHLAKQWPNVRINSVNPGANKTKMTKGSAMPFWLIPIRNLLFMKPIKGAMHLHRAAFDEKYKGQSGVYISDKKVLPLRYELNEGEIEKLLSNIVV